MRAVWLTVARDDCFSALQRAENSSIGMPQARVHRGRCFSALQRAENSSIRRGRAVLAGTPKFQCSSASRKFLNPRSPRGCVTRWRVSVLFSEPKIPQSVRRR